MEYVSIIDDDEDSNMILSAYLSEKWNVSVFEDWEEALKSYQQAPPDLIFLDISLPGTDGIEVLHRIRRVEGLKHVKAIAITGYSLPGDREKFIKKGFDGYISKPVEINALFHAVENGLK